jgi:hypothetical protein
MVLATLTFASLQLATVAASAAPSRVDGVPSVLPPISVKFAHILFAVPAVFTAIEFIFPAVPTILAAIEPSPRMPSFIAIQFAIVVAIKAFKILLPESRFFIRIDGAISIGVDALPQRHAWL